MEGYFVKELSILCEKEEFVLNLNKDVFFIFVNEGRELYSWVVAFLCYRVRVCVSNTDLVFINIWHDKDLNITTFIWVIKD